MNTDVSKIISTNRSRPESVATPKAKSVNWRLVVASLGVVIAGVAIYLGIQFWNENQAQREQEKNALQQQIYQQQVEARLQSQQFDALNKQVTDLKNRPPDVIYKTTIVEAKIDIPKIINKWRPRIAYIECDFYDTNGNWVTSKAGSGTLVEFPSGAQILTNKHVVSYQDKHNVGPFGSCRSKFSTTNNIFTSLVDQIRYSIKYDLANLKINLDEHLKSLPAARYCTQKAIVGDSVIILGYPGIGSQTDITATDGIISGYDGDYYITSAKIERGNSGGAAILIRPEGDCYLGIPSFVLTGKLESLARILDYSVLRWGQ